MTKPKTHPIFVPLSVKKIVEFNKGIGHNDLGKSLVNLLEDSPKYRKLKEAINLINGNVLDESVELDDLLNASSEEKTEEKANVEPTDSLYQEIGDSISPSSDNQNDN